MIRYSLAWQDPNDHLFDITITFTASDSETRPPGATPRPPDPLPKRGDLLLVPHGALSAGLASSPRMSGAVAGTISARRGEVDSSATAIRRVSRK